MTTTINEPARETPVAGEYDVIVVGGGPGGLMAAAAAGQQGLSTLIIERYGFLGGAGTMGGLSTFCGLHARVNGVDKRVVRGLTDELLDRLDEADALSRPHLSLADRIQAQAFDISAYKKVADDFLLHHGVEILFHSSAAAVAMDGEDRIGAVIVESKSGRQAYRAQIFIDGSGDADIAAWAGVPYEVSEKLLYPSLMFRINGVDAEAAGSAWKTIGEKMEAAEAAGTHTFPRKKPIVRPQRHDIEWRSNVTQLSDEQGNPLDGTDVQHLTRGEIIGRRQSFDAFGFIRENQAGFERSYIVDLAPQVGIRETRRIIGDYQLSEQDVLDCVDFDDTIGVNGWPVEAHVEGDVVYRFPREGGRGFNHMPYRMIVPQKVGNLFVVGRCASMTQWGQSAARVTGGCFVMGQAAGTAAAIALETGVRVGDIDVSELQRRLESGGVYLGRDLPPDVVREAKTKAAAA
ncbi:FAD-dependent oxidoreductase [Microbacterium sp. BWT-B31]|uniref:FAD-dependent oxidoreductase n=1 Tax=Microbacterium sp. BWT-B31 TaxID=3232072 RepID=UPI003526E5DB